MGRDGGVSLQIWLVFVLVSVALGACPPGSIEGFTEHGLAACYMYERFPAQFITAERLCRDAHGHLASVGDLFVNDFVAQGGVEAFEVMQVEDFWVGGNDLEHKNSWEWIDGAKFQFINWAKDEPKQDARSFCVALSLPEGLWYAKSCYDAKPYVCTVPPIKGIPEHHNHTRATRHPKPTTPSKRVGACDEGWSYFAKTGLCYKIVSDASDCYKPNIQEVSIHSKEENLFVGRLAQQKAKKREGNLKVRLSFAQYHPQKELSKTENNNTNQVKPWLIPHARGVDSRTQRLRVFEEMRRKNKHHKKHGAFSSEEELRDSWTWFDGSSFDFTNWANDEPKRLEKEEFTCAQLNTCHKECKKEKSNRFVWTAVDCQHVADYAVCTTNS